MKIFSPLYARAMAWSRHPKAPIFLGALSFCESVFFPVPPDVMLAPMCMANPKRAWWFAFITTLASALGGVLGYLIGYYAIDAIQPWLQTTSYWPAYETAVAWFKDYGFWAIFVAGFSPIPYKVFTIAGGAMAMAMPTFVLASLIGRGMRFFMVAGLLARGGPRMEALLHRYVDRIGWATVILVVIAGVWLAFF
ncbi:hypothetical protein CR159_15150 [Pollutimonas subterranea]|uniref:VTT domain-containing protein n=1 Tax=Pollutimonas subterranea TaxID=2045210 RepID=A0A2N4U250_9BURK|nr:YqaA family protein [Pollutimonas subterranea]PLC49091.1 hypothetical protein CR159_15150 [Pollutimonas subterranea]